MTSVADTISRESIGRGAPLLPDEPHTLAELFLHSAKKHNRPDALNYKKDGEWRAISSSEMIERAEAIALGLHALGLCKGDKAAILAANSPDWTLVDAGCQFAGVIDVPIYTTLAPDSVCYIVNDSTTKVFFLENKAAYERIAAVMLECLSLEKIVFFDPADVNVANAISLAELEQMGRDNQASGMIDELRESIQPTDIATLIYTSGTTGEPKGVMLTHNNILSNVIDAGENYEFSGDDVPLSVLPLSHVFERSAMYLYILNGMAVHYAESVDKVPDNLREVRPTIFVGVPRIFEKVYAKAKLKAAQTGGLKEKIFDWAMGKAREHALANASDMPVSPALAIKHELADKLVFSKLRQFFGGNLRSCITGGAALPDDIFLIFTGAGISIMQGYGLTETSPVISSNNPTAVHVGTVPKDVRHRKTAPDSSMGCDRKTPPLLLGGCITLGKAWFAGTFPALEDELVLLDVGQEAVNVPARVYHHALARIGVHYQIDPRVRASVSVRDMH